MWLAWMEHMFNREKESIRYCVIYGHISMAEKYKSEKGVYQIAKIPNRIHE